MIVKRRPRTAGQVMRAAGILAVLVVGCLVGPGAGRGGEPEVCRGQTVYVPAFSTVLSGERGFQLHLATTLVIRNLDRGSAIRVTAVDYLDAGGKRVRRYRELPSLIPPLGSEQVFVPESDTSGGSAPGFIVQWTSSAPVAPPLVQCVMIGARAGQGLSFLTSARVLETVAP